MTGAEPTVADLLGATRHGDIWTAERSYVQLVSHNLSDLRVVDSARVSTGRDRPNSTTGELSERDRGLVGFLARNRHGSPFEHGSATFLVVAPIFVAREWFRHRAGHSYNEMSGRYTVLEPVFYVPAPDNMRRRVGKPGRYRYAPIKDRRAAGAARDAMVKTYAATWAAYRRLLDDGVAPEQARAVLPVGIYTRFYWTANARSIMHWLSLRSAPDAQQEIRACAEQVEAIFRDLMPVTARAFATGGRPLLGRLPWLRRRGMVAP